MNLDDKPTKQKGNQKAWSELWWLYTLSANYLLYIININILYSIYEYCRKVHCTVKSDGEKKKENNFKPKSV